jgi:hypothetical protein
VSHDRHCEVLAEAQVTGLLHAVIGAHSGQLSALPL